MHPRTRYLLQTPAVGVSPHEILALDRPPIRALPNLKRGFGLFGSTGTGKTWLLVQTAGNILESYVLGQGDPSEAKLQPGYMIWVDWPETAASIKRRPLDVETTNKIHRIKTAAMLFLDDIGSETIKGTDDFALGVFKEIIVSRQKNNRPTWWTSNQNPDQLLDFYSSRVASRLLSAWPPTCVNGDDLRLNPAALPPPPKPPADHKTRAAGGRRAI
jgi:DNA replication protein DnaC